jgi:hypothetical protein
MGDTNNRTSCKITMIPHEQTVMKDEEQLTLCKAWIYSLTSECCCQPLRCLHLLRPFR